MDDQFKYFNNLNSISNNEAGIFASTLFHDVKMGFVCLAEKDSDTLHQKFERANTIEKAVAGLNPYVNNYISVNSFCSKKRSENNMFARTSFYIDVDAHKTTNAKKDLDQASKILAEAFDSGRLPVPTMITFTGRGFGIYYVVERSTNYTSSKTEKMRKLFHYTYKRLLNDYKDILKECEKVDVDSCISDGSRIVRIPSTTNTSNGEICHLIFVNRREDGSICYVKNFRDVAIAKNEFEKENSQKLIHFVPKNRNIYMLNSRINKLFQLAELRKDDACPMRELTLHMAYNFAIQAGYSEQKADDLIRKLNHVYTIPLAENEYAEVTSSIRGGKCYQYTDKKIIEKLNITEEENAKIGFLGVSRSIERKQRTYNRKLEKVQRDFEIANYIKTHPDMRIVDVAKLFHVGKTTVNNIIKEYSVNRNHCKNEYKGDIGDIQKQKVQKLDTILWCVRTTKDHDGFDAEKSDDKKCESAEALSSRNTVIPFYNARNKNQNPQLEAFLAYDNSFLSYLTEYCTGNYQKVSEIFKAKFSNFISDAGNEPLQEFVIKAVAKIGSKMEHSLILENCIPCLDELFRIMEGQKRVNSRSVFVINDGNNGSSMRVTYIDIVSMSSCKATFQYHPSDKNSDWWEVDIRTPRSKKSVLKDQERNTWLSIYNLNYVRIPELYHEMLNSDYHADFFDEFSLFDNLRYCCISKEAVKELFYLEQYLALSNKRVLRKIIPIIPESRYCSGEKTLQKMLEALDVSSAFDLELPIRKRSEAQIAASKLRRAQETRWNYVRAHRSKTTRLFSDLYFGIMKAIESGKDIISFKDRKISIVSLKKKGFYRILQEDLMFLENLYGDSITKENIIEYALARTF